MWNHPLRSEGLLAASEGQGVARLLSLHLSSLNSPHAKTNFIRSRQHPFTYHISTISTSS
jgi:hypothetical protein